MRCDAVEASGHVTTKPSIRNWTAFYKSGAHVVNVWCLTPGGLLCVHGRTEPPAMAVDRRAEVSRGHSRPYRVAEGLNKSGTVIMQKEISDGTCRAA